MAEPFLDTNVIIRLITRDQPDHLARATKLFKQIESGEVSVTITEAVIVETVQVLSSKVLYALPRTTIQTNLEVILSLKGLRLPNKRVYVRALDLYATTNLDFVDALNIAHMEHRGASRIVSFDRDYDRIPGVERIEPEADS